MTDLFKVHRKYLSSVHIKILLDIFACITSHAHQLNSETNVLVKLQRACSILEISDAPTVNFENESFLNYLQFLQDLLANNSSLSEEMNIEPLLVSVCENILRIYLECSGLQSAQKKLVTNKKQEELHWILPLSSVKKEELAARTPLVLLALGVLSGLESDSFRRYVSQLFPLLVDLVRSEHCTGEVQRVLSYMFESCIGPIVLNL